MAHPFAIPDALRFEPGSGGLTRALIATDACDAEIYLHGAHITQWTPRGQRPVLFVSSKSAYESGKAIRGGIPVIFPWFGQRSDAKQGPMHGFARTKQWSVESAALRDAGRLEMTLALNADSETRALGFDGFGLRFRIVFGAALELELETRNEGREPLVVEEALHTYFSIGDIRRVAVSGLEGAEYVDKTDGFKRKRQNSEPVRIAAETDRVYLNTTATCIIEEPLWRRRIAIEKSGSNTTVVWNPWIEKAKSLADMAADDWQRMICVETANAAEDAIRIAPGETHRMRATFGIEPLP